MDETAYKVDKHFGARGWLTALWMDWRRLNGCATIFCDCVWCDIFRAAIREWDKVTRD